MNILNFLANGIDCMKQVSLLAESNSSGIATRRMVFAGVAVNLIASVDGHIQKLYLDEVGMLDVQQLRLLYQKAGILAVQSQPEQSTLWVEPSVVNGATPFKVEPTPLGDVDCFRTMQGEHYLSIPGLPLLDILALLQKAENAASPEFEISFEM